MNNPANEPSPPPSQPYVVTPSTSSLSRDAESVQEPHGGMSRPVPEDSGIGSDCVVLGSEDEDTCTDYDGSDGNNEGDVNAERFTLPPPVKRFRIDPEQLFAVRKRLFCDSFERPTQDVFYVGGEKIDMKDPESCSIQQSLFARTFNSVLYFSKCTFADKNTTHRKLSWEARATQNRLKKTYAVNYRDFYLSVPTAVCYILRAVEDIKHVRCDEMICQLVPITCTIDRGLKQRLRVNGLELRTVNNSKSLSVNLNIDVKFVYAGHFQKKIIPEKGEKYVVVPTPCLGNYLNVAVSDLYDSIYGRTKEYIRRLFEQYPQDPPAVDAFDASRNNESSREREANDTLRYLVRTVGRDINLKKLDLDKNNVFVLTSTIRTVPKYLKPTKDLVCSIGSSPVEDAEAVFLSSFTRVRIMEDGSLNFQLYSKACMYTSDEEIFPASLDL